MSDVLHLTTYGDTREDALDKAKEIAAGYFDTYPHLVKGRIEYAGAKYLIDTSLSVGVPRQGVNYFIVESVWKVLDNQTEWIVG